MLIHLIVAASAWVSVATPDDAALRLELERTLSAMASSATRADADAYLAHVWAGDTEFLHEQTYFANDLRRKPPESIEFAIGELKPGDGTADADVTMTWTMPGGKPRSVKTLTRFIRAENGPEGAREGPGSAGGWLYAGEVWEVFEAPAGNGRVKVMHDPGLAELAERTAEAFTEVRGVVEEAFGLAAEPIAARTQKIKLYGSMRHLQASICLSYTDGLSGWNEPGESVKLLVSERTRPRGLRTLLAHEYGHVSTFELGSRANEMPWWILEGVAELSSVPFGGRNPDRVVRANSKADKLAKWEDLSDFRTTRPELSAFVYVQGHHMVAYIASRWSRPALNEWMTAMARGAALDEATRRVLGMSFDELDAAWREALKIDPPAEAPEAPQAPPPGAPGGDPAGTPPAQQGTPAPVSG